MRISDKTDFDDEKFRLIVAAVKNDINLSTFGEVFFVVSPKVCIFVTFKEVATLCVSNDEGQVEASVKSAMRARQG